MGGPGSGWRSENVGPGRKKKIAIAVEGIGLPQKPEGLPAAVGKAWDELVSLTSGVCFSQDAELLLECATLQVRQAAFRAALADDPLDEDLNRLSLAVGRALLTALGKLGLTPRDRQNLLVPRPDTAEDDDPISALVKRRDQERTGVPSRKHDLPTVTAPRNKSQ